MRRPTQAVADLAALSASFRVAFPQRYASAASKGWSLVAIPVRDQMVGSVRTSLFVIAGAVGLVLLIACVNVANLLLARGATRQREIAIRLALGAGRARVVRQLLTESTVLAGLGGVVGLLLAWIGIRLILHLDAGEIPRLADTRIDATVLAVLTRPVDRSPACSSASCRRFSNRSANLRGTLGDGGRGASGGRDGNRLRRVARRRAGRDGAARARRRRAARPKLPCAAACQAGILAGERRHPRSSRCRGRSTTAPRRSSSFIEQLRASTAAIPGVSEVSAVYPVPMGGDGWSGSFNVEGEPGGPNDPLPHAEYGVAMPGYFHTLRDSADRRPRLRGDRSTEIRRRS